MKVQAYLCVKKTSQWRSTLRVTKSNPSLDYNEVALRLNLELPDELFTKPRLEATIAIPKDAVSAPVIEAEVVDNVEQIIKQQTGFEVRLQVIPPEENKTS
jgi:hypothetical protein